LRRFAISSWLAARIDLKTIQHWSGHASLALVLDRYGHLIPRDGDHARIAAAEQILGATIRHIDQFNGRKPPVS
jgi:integrase